MYNERKFKRFMSMLLLIVTLLNGIALTNQKVYAAVTPQKVTEAIDKFVGAIGKFAARDASANIGQIANFCNRLAGLTSLASGVIGVLQMAGIIKDPTTVMLGKILDAVKDVQTTLDNMNQTLNQIAQELINIQVAQQEIDRNTKATMMSTNWNNFNTNYTEKLQTYANEYEAKITTGIRDWWKQASHEGVYVLMTKRYTEEDSLTYSKKKYSEGLPEKSDINDEIVSADWSIGIPSDCMPNTGAIDFNADTYRDEFKKVMITALDNAIKDGKLASDCGASVISEYSGESKDVMLENYADNVLNTVIYKTACEVMSDNNSWVAQVISTYMQYCDNLLQQNSGVNAFLNYIFLTHVFEGQVKEDIVNFLDGMIAQAGFYGSFAMTCAGQDNLQTTSAKEQIQEYFANTVLSLDEKKAKAITGKDNYCYIVGAVITRGIITLASNIVIEKSDDDRYDGFSASAWEVTLPAMVNSVYMPLLYKQYAAFPYGADSFHHYLYKYGIQPDKYNTIYLTQYNGVQTFILSEGIHMKAWSAIRDASYFTDRNWYYINVGTSSGVEEKYYHVHDKVIGDLFDATTGGQFVNSMLAARAFYGESHLLWDDDEAWAFNSEGIVTTKLDLPQHNVLVDFLKDWPILELTPYHDTSGDKVNDPNNPFFAFNNVSLVEDITTHIGLQCEKKSKDITEVLLDSESFPYTGQPVEPDVTVFASDDVVPEDGYAVTYLNNIESGDYGVVRVEGKGDYAGVITRHFEITGSSNSSTTWNGRSSNGGCNAMNCMGLLLGLAFVIRKFTTKNEH